LSRPRIITEFIGSTLRTTFVCSGATVSPIHSALYDKNESLVTSVAATSSGDGHYFADLSLPNSPQWMVNKWSGVINANTYVRYALVQVQAVEVD
jgi:hypothetical protein